MDDEDDLQAAGAKGDAPGNEISDLSGLGARRQHHDNGQRIRSSRWRDWVRLGSPVLLAFSAGNGIEQLHGRGRELFLLATEHPGEFSAVTLTQGTELDALDGGALALGRKLGQDLGQVRGLEVLRVYDILGKRASFVELLLRLRVDEELEVVGLGQSV